MKFINVVTPLGIEFAIGTAEPYPMMPTDNRNNQMAFQWIMQRFHKQGPAQWVMEAVAKASHSWLEAEGFSELKDNPGYEWQTVESITGNMKELDECLPREKGELSPEAKEHQAKMADIKAKIQERVRAMEAKRKEGSK